MTRTIGLADDAYDALASVKRPDESFSDVTRRLVAEHTRRRSLADSAGTWPMSEEEADQLVQGLYAARDEGETGRPAQ